MTRCVDGPVGKHGIRVVIENRKIGSLTPLGTPRTKIKDAWTALSSSSVITQSYDGNGLRVKKNEYGYATFYLRSSVLGGQVIAEIDGNGGWQRGYVYVGGSVMAVQQGGGVFWQYEDPVTKSKRTTDINGNVMSVIETDPWGADTNRSSYAAFQPKRYTTYDRDGNGSDEAMFRRYNRKHSRFDQPDPYEGSYDLTDPQTLNRYGYVRNDPANLTDPTGLYWITHQYCSQAEGGPWHCETVDEWVNSNDDITTSLTLLGGGSVIDGGGGTDPQNSIADHEFAHSRVRCPPTGEQLNKNPAVQKALKKAFELSKSTRVERGGWIYWNKSTNKVFTIIKDPPTINPLNPKAGDTYLQVYLSYPASPPKGWAIVGDFHTHPEDVGPDDWDEGNENNLYRVPGIVQTPNRSIPYGPNRGIWKSDLPAGCK